MGNKQKTHKGLAKRVKVTGGGKVRRHKAFKSHLMSSKSGSRVRKLRRPAILKGRNAKRALESLNT